jgi:hypothetical protein
MVDDTLVHHNKVMTTLREVTPSNASVFLICLGEITSAVLFAKMSSQGYDLRESLEQLKLIWPLEPWFSIAPLLNA